MKQKKINKKVQLNKITIANLGRADQREAKGAGTGITCMLCDSNISCYINKCLIEFTDPAVCDTDIECP